MRIILVGNANVGKSVVFSLLTGTYATVSNYPGTTVELMTGDMSLGKQKFRLVDTPGVTSLVPSSEDEQVTRDLLEDQDEKLIIQVADAKNLKRALLLFFELSALKKPLILVLNMADEARQRGVNIDAKKLSQVLGVPVILTVATDGAGISELKKTILQMNVDISRPQQLPVSPSSQRALYKKIFEIEKTVVVAESGSRKLSEYFGNITMTSIVGYPVLLFVLYLMYLFVGRFAAITGVGYFEDVIFGAYINPFVMSVVGMVFQTGFIRDLLVGEYGIFTMALTYAFAIVFPIVTAFFMFFGVLEDSGYLPRLAILLNKPFKLLGLNGKAVIPMVLGLGCDTMATITTRTLDTKKERIIATLLLALAVPCSAQLGVMLGMLSAVSAKVTVIWFAIMMLVIFLVGFLSKFIIKGEQSIFIIEIPPLRIPKLSNIAIKTLARLEWYLKEAVPLFIYGTLILFAADKLGLLLVIERLLAPAVTGLLGLPEKAAQAFLIGFLRRDFGAAGLYMMQKDGLLDNVQVLVSVVTITLFVPCIAQFLVMIKERGLKTALYIAGFVFPFAFSVGALLNFFFRHFGLTL